MGQEELWTGYKITALKMIATDRIRKELETEERYCTRDGRSEEFIWDRLYQMTMNISKDEFLHKREDKSQKNHGGSSPMDVGNLNMGGGMQNQNGKGGNWWDGFDPQDNMIQGKGKGGGDSGRSLPARKGGRTKKF